MKNKKKNICIISAFYNEEQNLRKFINNFDIARSKLIKKGYLVKLILVNDGSHDNSKKIVQEVIKFKKYIKLINFKKNYGQQLAIFSALDLTLISSSIPPISDLKISISKLLVLP